MTHAQNTTSPQPALLRNNNGITTPVNNNSCEAVSIIAPSNSTTEALIPHEKLREAPTPNVPLIAQNRPPAQPFGGYSHLKVKKSSRYKLNKERVEII